MVNKVVYKGARKTHWPQGPLRSWFAPVSVCTKGQLANKVTRAIERSSIHLRASNVTDTVVVLAVHR